jgi:hypothetical protein
LHFISYQELHLEKTRIYLPDVCQHFEKSVVHQNLRKFRFLSDHVSLKWHPYLTRCIESYMPRLTELEIQPHAAAGKSYLPKKSNDLRLYKTNLAGIICLI